MSIPSKLINGIMFQIGWFVCILTGSFIGFLYTGIAIALHFWILQKTKITFSILHETTWLLCFFLFGILIETLFFSTGTLRIDSGHVSSLTFPPPWLVFLWILFGIAMRTSLSFLFKWRIFSSIALFVIAPMNYWAGVHLNTTISLATPFVFSFAVIGTVWVIFFNILCVIQKRLFGEYHDR